MSFHDQLIAQTRLAQQELLSVPIIQGALQGRVSIPSYVAFLTQAYHHVRHTVPLLKACKAALPAHHAWLNDAMDEYVEEEQGHDEWILNDIAACGGDVAVAVQRARAYAPAGMLVQVECDTEAQVRAALAVGAGALLLDNMPNHALRECVELAQGKAWTEASGGVSLDTVRGIAETGVDRISIGALTHSAPSLDLALDFE